MHTHGGWKEGEIDTGSSATHSYTGASQGIESNLSQFRPLICAVCVHARRMAKAMIINLAFPGDENRGLLSDTCSRPGGGEREGLDLSALLVFIRHIYILSSRTWWGEQQISGQRLVHVQQNGPPPAKEKDQGSRERREKGEREKADILPYLCLRKANAGVFSVGMRTACNQRSSSPIF